MCTAVVFTVLFIFTYYLTVLVLKSPRIMIMNWMLPRISLLFFLSSTIIILFVKFLPTFMFFQYFLCIAMDTPFSYSFVLCNATIEMYVFVSLIWSFLSFLFPLAPQCQLSSLSFLWNPLVPSFRLFSNQPYHWINFTFLVESCHHQRLVSIGVVFYINFRILLNNNRELQYESNLNLILFKTDWKTHCVSFENKFGLHLI